MTGEYVLPASATAALMIYGAFIVTLKSIQSRKYTTQSAFFPKTQLVGILMPLFPSVQGLVVVLVREINDIRCERLELRT